MLAGVTFKLDDRVSTAMSTNAALKVARAAGIQIGVDGDDLVLEAAVPPPPGVFDLVSHHKAQIIELLRATSDEWTAEEWRAFFDERAGITEVDGVRTRAEAEAIAFESCVVEWLNRHPICSDPDRCAWCDKPDRDGHAVVPFGVESHGHAWLHPECWPNWFEHRRQVATDALAKMGFIRDAISRLSTDGARSLSRHSKLLA